MSKDRYVHFLREQLATTSLIADTKVFNLIVEIASLSDEHLKQFARFYDLCSFDAIRKVAKEELDQADDI